MHIAQQAFIVTGGASGLGAATARRLAAAGGKVLIVDVQDAAGQELAQALGGGYAHCDVTLATEAQAAVAEAQKLGPLRGLVNCAGVAPATRTLGKDGPHPLDSFARAVNVNLIGSFNMARLAAAAMAQQESMIDGERGIIIHTASVAAYDGQIGQTAYAASKAGIVGMTLPMARDLAGLGIRVNTIAPGIFDTPLMQAASEDVRRPLIAATQFPKRLGEPREFGELALHIMQNSFLNGEVLRIDGGLRMPAR